jgi:hypothetical protein
MARSRIIAIGCFVSTLGVGQLLIRQQATDESALVATPASAIHDSTIRASDDCSESAASADVRRVSLTAGAHIHEDEHDAALRLADPCAASHVAVQSGRWSDPGTWQDRRVPGAGSRILIPAAIAVHVDRVFDRTAFDWVRVDGHLAFRPDVDTALTVRTIVVSDAGILTVGSSAEPVHRGVKARLIFAPRAGRDRRGDPLDLAGGLVSSGVVQMVGPQRDGSLATGTPLRPGTRRIEFAVAPAGWQVGDRLLVPGTVFQSDQDELRTIVRLSDDGRTVTFDRPLRRDHYAPPGVPVRIGNLTRNIELGSLVAAPLAARGHVMIMHVQTGTTFDGVAFLRLGRTDARDAHTHPVIGPDGLTEPTTDANTIGRYAVHFHVRSGARRNVPPHVIRNSVVIDSPKHGIVNHGGHVLAENNVTFRIVGAHLVAENGSEIGAFRGNMAVRSAGSGDTPIQSRMNVYDLGHAGHGIWLQGFGVELTDNWVSGHAEGGIVTIGNSFIENGAEVFFAAENLAAPAPLDALGRVVSSNVDLHMARNVVAGAKQGFVLWTHKLEAPRANPSLVEDLTIWNIQNADHAVLLAYAQHTILRNVRLVGPGGLGSGTVGIGGNMFAGDIIIDGGSIEGFAEGLHVPQRGRNIVRNTVLANPVDIKIRTANNRNRYVHLDHPVFSHGARPGHVNIQMADLEIPHNLDAAVIFLEDRIDLTDQQGRNQRLFFPSQRADSIPFPDGRVEALRGLTSGAIHARFGIAPGGTLAPGEAGPLAASNALAVASPQATQVDANPSPGRRVGEGYSLQRDHFSRVADTTAADEWSVAPATAATKGPTGLVFVDRTPPKFMLFNCLLPLQIHPDDVPFGYRAMGVVIDKVGTELSSIVHGQTFRNLTVGDDGFVRVSFTVADMAGNTTRVDLPLQVTPDALRRGSNLEFFMQRKHCEDSGINSVHADARRFYESGEWRLAAAAR